MIYIDQVKSKFKKRYPAVYEKFENSTAGLEEFRWVVDNMSTFMDKKEAYTVLKESQLESVDKNGVHKYKEQ